MSSGFVHADGDPVVITDTPAPLFPGDVLPPDIYTFQPAEFWQHPDDSYWLQFSNWVIASQRANSALVEKFGEWADRTLSGSPQALPSNASYLRIGFATASEYGDPFKFEPEGRFRLDIPTVQEKLRLIVESESDELIPLAERRRSRQIPSDERTENEPTGALRFISEIGDAINLNNDIGIRLRLPVDAFWRATARKQWPLDEHWKLQVQQRVFYYHLSGWGESTWMGIGRDIGNGWLFLTSSELEWVHSNREFEMSQVFNVYKDLNNRSSINPRLGVLGESQPGWRTTSYFADVTYRYRLYDDWLFGEIIPAFDFPRDKSFKDQASLVLRIEMYLSGNLNQ
ncbi:hypothetical protein SAMN04487960_102451 [Marinobacter mobilis]|uniref:Uncharacterized protein n=2 Tax=Marinobacter mobilis TaxID=488533 RepID=A0A1H2TI68_9GAMM|nr:hypothetical protein SAMN04487960_102451 [Marinobacter mobilis]